MGSDAADTKPINHQQLAMKSTKGIVLLITLGVMVFLLNLDPQVTQGIITSEARSTMELQQDMEEETSVALKEQIASLQQTHQAQVEQLTNALKEMDAKLANQKTNLDNKVTNDLKAIQSQHQKDLDEKMAQVQELQNAFEQEKEGLKQELQQLRQSQQAAMAAAATTTSAATTTTASTPAATTGLATGKPVIVLGMPKSGTTSVYSYFNCSGVRTQHYCSQGDLNDHPPCAHGLMSSCMLRNLKRRHAGEPIGMMEGCGEYDVYAQIDGERDVIRVTHPNGDHVKASLNDDGSGDWTTTMRMFLPQHFLLEELHQEHPHATYVLPLRTPQAWASSVDRWFNLKQFFFQEWKHQSNGTYGMPRAGLSKTAWLAKVYEEHNEVVREFVKRHPSHRLIEVNITDPQAGQLMQDAFGYDQTCWGHANKNGKKPASK